jgi:hypothetical protein
MEKPEKGAKPAWQREAVIATFGLVILIFVIALLMFLTGQMER